LLLTIRASHHNVTRPGLTVIHSFANKLAQRDNQAFQ
jgi:hypothetical protein